MDPENVFAHIDSPPSEWRYNEIKKFLEIIDSSDSFVYFGFFLSFSSWRLIF